MQHLQNLKTTLLDPSIQSKSQLYRFTEQLASGLPGPQGNALLLLKANVPTPSAGIVLPGSLRKQMRVQLCLDLAPDKKFIRHVRPGAERTTGGSHSDAGGPVYRLWLSRLPIPHKYEVFDRLGL